MVRVTSLGIRQLEIEDSCPKCGTETGTDLGDEADSVGEWHTITFWCEKCDLEWVRRYRIAVQFSRTREFPA